MKVMLCMPGRVFSSDFLLSYIRLTKGFQENGIAYGNLFSYSANVFQTRNNILGLPKYINKPKPFKDMEYDYMLWIDSDMVYQYEHFDALIKRKKDIISGLYLQDEEEYAAVVDFMPANGRWRFLKRGELDFDYALQEVDWVGMGFMLIKQGVVETLGYPWFKARTVSSAVATQDASEDASFCLDLKDKGFKIWIDPAVRLGHLKERMLA